MNSFENQLLIAMPNLDDSYFNKTVTYICEHNAEGAMGLIINLPINVTLNELLTQIDEDKIDAPELDQQVLTGGPVSQDRGFVLHSTQTGWNSSLALTDDVKFMVTLGYAGWGPGQLEEEIKANSWLLTPADGDIIFDTPIEQRWKKATEKLGIDMAHLSSEVGHA